MVGCWLLIPNPSGSSRPTYHVKCGWGGRRAHARSWRPWFPGQQPHHATSCDECRRGRIFYNPGSGRYINASHSRCSCGGGSGRYNPYWRNNWSLNYWSPSFTPFTMYVWMEIHEPVFFPFRSLCASYSRSVASTSASAWWYAGLFQRRISTLPSFSIIKWSTDRNYFYPWRATTRWLVMIYNCVQLSGAYRLGSFSTKPACLNGSQETLHVWMCFPASCKSDGSNSHFRESSTGWNATLTPVEYMVTTRSPLPQNNGNLTLPFFGGNYPMVILVNIINYYIFILIGSPG